MHCHLSHKVFTFARFQNGVGLVRITSGLREVVVLSLFFSFIFSSGSYLTQWSESVLAIFVTGHERNISVKSF